MEKPILSVVTPVFNEQESLPAFYARMIPIMEGIGLPFEIIAVNDGSRDDTEKIIREYSGKDKRLRGVTFSRNFGQMPAIFCGMTKAVGDAVIVMDADLQDTPETIVEMVAKWKEGYDVVNAKRTARKGEGFIKKFTSAAFIRITNKLSGLDMPANSGEFKLYDRKVVDAIISMPEHSRYLRAQTAWLGFKQTDVFFERKERAAGETKYNMKKMLRLAESAIIPNSPKLLNFRLKFGICLAISSLTAYLVFVILGLCGTWLPLTAWLIPTVFFGASLAVISAGVTDRYLGYMYEDIKRRPIFVVREEFNPYEDD